MQTERVTFLANPSLKASLEAFAAANNQSLGHVLREASQHWIAQQQSGDDSDDDAALDALLPIIEEELPKWKARLDSMEQSIDRARAAIQAALKDEAV